MDADLSATLENTPWSEGNDIRRGLAGYLFRSGGGQLSWHTHGPRRSPPAGSVELWPRGLASRMAMSRVPAPVSGQHRGLAPGPASPQSDTPGGARSVEGRTVTGCQRSWQPSALMADLRSRFRS